MLLKILYRLISYLRYRRALKAVENAQDQLGEIHGFLYDKMGAGDRTLLNNSLELARKKISEEKQNFREMLW